MFLRMSLEPSPMTSLKYLGSVDCTSFVFVGQTLESSYNSCFLRERSFFCFNYLILPNSPDLRAKYFLRPSTLTNMPMLHT